MGKGSFNKSMGGFGGGGGMNNMLKQAQKMQADIARVQAEIEEYTLTETSGGGAVSVKINGKREISELKINPEVIDPEDAEMLQDLIISAVNGALAKLEEYSASEMSKVTGGMPGLF